MNWISRNIRDLYYLESETNTQLCSKKAKFNIFPPKIVVLNKFSSKYKLPGIKCCLKKEEKWAVYVGSKTPRSTKLNSEVPQGCVLSPFLFPMLSLDCTSKFCTNHLNEMADKTKQNKTAL